VDRATPSVRLVLIGAALVGCNLGLLLVSLPLFIQERTGSVFLVGLVVAMPFLADAIMGFVWGGLSDRLGDRRRPIIYGLAVGGVLFFIFPAAAAQPLVLLVLRLVQVLFLSVAILGIALMTELRPTTRGRAGAEVLGSGAFGVVLGVLASGPLLERVGMDGIFVACGVVVLVAAAAILPVAEPAKHQVQVGPREILAIAGRPVLRTLLVVVLLLYTANAMGFAVAQLYLASIGFSRTQIGLLTGLLVIGGIAILIPLGHVIDSRGRRPVLILAPLCYLAHWGGLALVSSPVAAAFFYASPVWPLLLAPAAAIATDTTAVSERGRGIGAVNAFIAVGNGLGSVLGGAVAQATGSYRATFAAALVFVGISMVIAVTLRETLHQ